jgi:hypothetical protein
VGRPAGRPEVGGLFGENPNERGDDAC